MSDNITEFGNEFGTMAQRVYLALAAGEKHVLTFIAARPGEGTSTVARRFAETYAAQTHSKTLLIDAGVIDTARFVTDGIDPTSGMVETFVAGKPIKSVVHSIEQDVYLARWAGRHAHHTSSSKFHRNEELWKSLKQEFDMIVIDAPSLQDSPEGLGFAAYANGTILVIEAETTRQAVAENLRDTLVAAGARILGSVLNKRQHYIPQKMYARM